MSHELRTPLTSILGFSSVLLQQLFGSLTDKQRQYLETISASSNHLVTLRVSQSDHDIEFAVIDTGIGIAPSDQALLFQPFQQLVSGLDRKYDGTGLGLALSQKLAQLHDGEITVKSNVAQGSCFTLRLPCRNPI